MSGISATLSLKPDLEAAQQRWLAFWQQVVRCGVADAAPCIAFHQLQIEEVACALGMEQPEIPQSLCRVGETSFSFLMPVIRNALPDFLQNIIARHLVVEAHVAFEET